MHFRSNYETRSNYWNQQEKQDEEKKQYLKKINDSRTNKMVKGMDIT